MIIEDLKQYFDLVGWNESDLICVGEINHGNGKWTQHFCTVAELYEMDRTTDYPSSQYYSIGLFSKAGSRRKNDVIGTKELVIDIDFKAISDDIKEAQSKANELIALLPVPTVKVMSGHGIQLHYRLFSEQNGTRTNYVKGDEYEAVYRRLIAYFDKDFTDYLDSTFSCEHTFRLPFSINNKDTANPVAVQILDANDVEYRLSDFAALVPNDFEMETLSGTETEKRAVKRAVRRELKSGLDRSAIVFRIISNLLNNYPTISDTRIIAVLRKSKELVERYATDEKLRADVRRIMAKHKKERTQIQSVIPVETMSAIQDYDLGHLEAERHEFDHKVFNTRTDKISTMLQVFDRLWNDDKSGIISVPCSSGKTTGALIYAAYLANNVFRLAGSQKIWFISEKIEDVKANADTLNKLGCRALAFHGRPQDCKYSDRDFISSSKPCKDCDNKGTCGGYNRYVYDLDKSLRRCDVLCCTHAFFRSVTAKGKEVNAALVIIDESPSLLETYTLDNDAVKLIKDHISRKDEALQYEFLWEVESKIYSVCNDLGTHKIQPLNLTDFEDTKLVALLNAQKGYSGSLETLEKVRGFFNFFSHSENIYAMKQEHFGKELYRFVSGKIDLHIDNTVVWILDGSARNQLVRWQGMKMITVPELETSYQNMTVRLLRGIPTKSNLSKDATQKKFTNAASTFHNKEVCLFVNVGQENDKFVLQVKAQLESQGNTVMILNRGQAKGTNIARSCNGNLLNMSLFTDIPDYALRASIFHGKEYAESDIFHEVEIAKGVFRMFPKFQTYGLENKEINSIAIRQQETDLYQAIMRGIIRDCHTADYRVYAVCSEQSIIDALADDLPSAKIEMEGQEVIDLWLSGKTVNEIATALSMPKQNVSFEIKQYCIGDDVA